MVQVELSVTNGALAQWVSQNSGTTNNTKVKYR